MIIAVFFGMDKLLGLFRQVIIGRQFGVGADLDVFNAANNVPDLLFALISGGALAVAFIPVLSAAMEQQGQTALWSLFSRVANLAFLITGVLSLVVAVFADDLVRARLGVAPGFTAERQQLVAELMRLNLIATLVFSLSGLVSAGLQANQHFLLPAMAPVLYDVGQIFGAVVLAPATGYRLGPVEFPAADLGVYGLVYGVILGAGLHLGIQIPGLLRFGFRWAPRLGWSDPGVRNVARLMLPRIFTIGTFQLIFVLQDNLASRLEVGSVTGLAFGWLIMQVPETLFGTALGIAILPTLSEHFARHDDQAFELSLARALRVLFALALPTALLLSIGLRPLVQAAFRFSDAGTDLVVWAARAYLVGLAGHTLLEVAARAFYARQNARTPLLASFVTLVAFSTLGVLLFRRFGGTGIALSNSLAFSLEALMLLWLLARTFPGLLGQIRSLGRIALGTALAGLVCWASYQALPLPPLAASVASLWLGAAAVALFIRPELRELARL